MLVSIFGKSSGFRAVIMLSLEKNALTRVTHCGVASITAPYIMKFILVYMSRVQTLNYVFDYIWQKWIIIK